MEIKLLAIDVDGCLTDGLYYVFARGGLSKSFYTRDFAALEKLPKEIGIIFITSSDDNCIYEKYKALNDDLRDKIIIFSGIKDKYETLSSHLKVRNLTWENVAYIGDADNDLECIKSAKISGCPADATKEVQEEVNFLSCKIGGHGCVEDFVNYILEKIKCQKC